MKFHIYHHYPDGVFTVLESKLNQIVSLLKTLIYKENEMLQEMQILIDKVAEVASVEASATLAIQAIVVKLNDMAANATDLAEVKTQALALAQSLTEATAPLSAAIATVPA